MEKEVKELRIGIRTGLGTNGVRKEALAMVKAMLQEKTSQPITQKWCKYEASNLEYDPDDTTTWGYLYNHKWGMVVTAYVIDFDHIKAVMLDFGYDEVVKQIY